MFMTAVKLLITVCGLDLFFFGLFLEYNNNVMLWTCKLERDTTKRCIHLLSQCRTYFIFID